MLDSNYLCSDLCLEESIRSRRADAGALRAGTGSPIVAMIGHSAGAISRALGRIALWADGNSEFTIGTPHRASTH